MKVEMRKVDELRPYGNNPRQNIGAVAAVAESIREFGFRNPILVDNDGTVINGHTRLAAAKTLGLETVPVIVAADLTDAQIKALRIVDNKTSEIANWDYDLLAEELEAIDSIDPALVALTGFQMDTILDELATKGYDSISIEPETDEVPRRQIPTLTFGHNKIPLSDQEETLLNEAYGAYVETNRTNLGFIAFILGR